MFKDVKDSIDTFNEDDGRNIKQWIRDFEETASLCEWSEVQKTIYAKKLLRGLARLFIKYESLGKTWKDIKLLLRPADVMYFRTEYFSLIHRLTR